MYRHGIHIELTLGAISLVLLIASQTSAAILFIVLALVISALIRHKADRGAINEKKDYDSSIKQFTSLKEQVSALQNETDSLKGDFSVFQNETSPQLETLRSDVDVLYQEDSPIKLALSSSRSVSERIEHIFSLLENQSQEIQLIQAKDEGLKDLSDQLQDLFSTITNGAITPVQDSLESYDCFIEALDSCEKRLIIVSPWIKDNALNYKKPEESKTIKNLIINNLEHEREIYFGWGHWRDTYTFRGKYLPKLKRGTPREKFFNAVERDPDNSNFYSGFKWLKSLEEDYPSYFKLWLSGNSRGSR